MSQRFRTFLLLLFALPIAAHGASRVRAKVLVGVQAAAVPAELRSSAFTLTVNGHAMDVAHAAANYEYASLDGTDPMNIAITATEPGFWEHGVEIQPWRLGLRATRQGQTIRFRLDRSTVLKPNRIASVKLSISRPNDFLQHAHILFLFVGTPPLPPPRDPAVHVYPPGIYHQSLNPKSGETYYLAPGSYFYGSLNLWNVQNVRILGRGTIIYDGPQDPENDEGWMQRPDWHCIGAYQAVKVEIDGLTCLVRSRTWSIQMKDSSGFLYDDLRVIGGNAANANQDGMDWLGGGDTIVRNSFLRTSDDVFAMQGNWDGYKDADMLRPGRKVENILIEHSVLSTSISNIVRAGWPRKVYSSSNFTLRDSDILDGGIGACGQSFGLIGLWGAQGAKGDHTNYTFENLFLDHWYSLMQIEQESPGIHGFSFRNLWVLDQPPLVDSTLAGQVSDVTIDNVKFGQRSATTNADLPLTLVGGAQPPRILPAHEPIANFTVTPPVFAPGEWVTFTADAVAGARYTWFFGDGSRAAGRRVRHRFPDAEGTELDGGDGSGRLGRFRVMLEVEDRQGHQDWAAQGLVAIDRWLGAIPLPAASQAGLSWQIYPGMWTELPNFATAQSIFAGESRSLYANAQGFTRYAAVWDGFLDIPADGGYSFHLLDRDGARLVIDGVEVARTGPPFAQVCGAPGNAMRYARGALGLRAGKHSFHLEGLHATSQGLPRLLWEGPALPLTDVPSAAYSHLRQDAVKSTTSKDHTVH